MSEPRPALLTADDLVPDRALSATDTDRLDHLPIAERIAELVVSAQAPVNIALFGAWGSGKSSFAQLLREALKGQKGRTQMVVYDTWTSAGESFQRSFISNAASELGFKRGRRDGHDFHEGLYERTRRLRVSGADVGRFLFWLIAAGIVALALIGLLAGLLVWLTPVTIDNLLTVLPWATFVGAALGLLAAVIKEGLAGAKLDVESSAPTQEQFRQTFRDLVARAKRKHKADRIVFFLDELDRCRPAQVNEVLAAVKHFLDQPSCVFIVAADREVMERALDELPQANPVIVDAPYYSSASEFIDKVFQHQLALPPLRMRRLSLFTRELIVAKSAGIWHELKAADGGRRLDEVLYVAVPRHVRSPRRVKVLLNNFATSARIAQARGIDWLEHATEIAKLTALQTEFPLLGADLPREPRLLTLLLNGHENPSPQLKRLLKKHELPLAAEQEAGGDDEIADPTPTDRPLVDEKVVELKLVQRRHLLSYLRGTASYPDPGRDLLFLEVAGKAANIEDAAFADALETAAIEDPPRAIAAAEGQSTDDRRNALSVLADLIMQEVGRERANATTTLLGVARLLANDVRPHEHEVASALRMQQREAGFDEEHLAQALAVAIKVSARDLSEVILADGRLWATAERTGEVAALADQLPSELRPEIWKRVGEGYARGDDAVALPLRHLDAAVAEELLDSPPFQTALEARLAASAEAEPTLEPPALALFSAIDERSEGMGRLRGSVIWDLLAAGDDGYPSALQFIDQLDAIEPEDAGLRNLCALEAIGEIAPIADIAAWAQRLSPADEPWDAEANKARKALIRCFTEWSPTAKLEEAVERLVQLVPTEDDENADELVEPLKSAMGSAAWWTTGDDTAAQQRLHRAALLLRAIGPDSFKVASAAVLADLEAALAATQAAAQRPNNFSRAVRSVRRVAVELTRDNLDSLVTNLASIAVPDPLDLALIKERLLIAAAARLNNLPQEAPAYAVAAAQMERLRSEEDFIAFLERWLALAPPPSDVIAVIRPMAGSASAQARRAVADWAKGQTDADRTDLLLALVNEQPDISSWVDGIAGSGLDEPRLVETIGATVRSRGRADERTDYLRSLAAFRPATSEGQRAVADLFNWLVERATKVDFDNAMTLAPALGSNHGSVTRLNAAMKAAGDRGHEPTGRALEHLQRAGVKLTKKRVSKPIWDRWLRLRP